MLLPFSSALRKWNAVAAQCAGGPRSNPPALVADEFRSGNVGHDYDAPDSFRQHAIVVMNAYYASLASTASLHAAPRNPEAPLVVAGNFAGNSNVIIRLTGRASQ
jgi:hypothetical protein